jgi:hypothetical protein
MAKARHKPIPKSQVEGPIVDLLEVRTRKSRRPNTRAENEKLAKAVFDLVRDRPFAGVLTPRVKLPAHFLPSPQTSPPAKPRAKKQHRKVQGFQDKRIEVKRKQLFPDGWPSREKLADPDLVQIVVNAFKKDPKIEGLGIPDPKSILRAAGRIPRKK